MDRGRGGQQTVFVNLSHTLASPQASRCVGDSAFAGVVQMQRYSLVPPFGLDFPKRRAGASAGRPGRREGLSGSRPTNVRIGRATSIKPE